MTDLGAYLREGAARPWKAAVHDCCAWPARWAGIELPPYSSDEEGRALVEEAGGLTALWTSIIAGKLERVENPQEGDIGIILAAGPGGRSTEVGAIFTGTRWAIASPRGGIACASTRPIAIWRTG